MKRFLTTKTAVALVLLAAIPLQAADTIRYNSKPGSKMRIEGTSNIHDWQVEGKLIGGFMEVPADFPTEPGKEAKAGKVEAKVEAFVPVRSLASIEKDGSPYNTKMDDIMYEKLKASEHQRVTYKVKELTLKEAAKSKDAPYVYDSKGDLTVGGVTKEVSMAVNILPTADKKMKVSGTVEVKMSDFGIEPPAPKIALGLIKTGDPVKLIFDWSLAQKEPAAN
jgi:polyisoprenoid-binding protein YceI